MRLNYPFSSNVMFINMHSLKNRPYTSIYKNNLHGWFCFVAMNATSKCDWWFKTDEVY